MTEQEFRRLIDTSISAQWKFRNRWEHVTEDSSVRLDIDRSNVILSELAERLDDNYPFFHPRYAGQMLKPPHPIAIAAYLMAMQINPNNHALDGGPATAKMELEVIDQIASMFGYTEHLGHLTSSGTIANLEALWIARCIHPNKSVAYSPNAHYTHRRLCEVIKCSALELDVTDLDAVEKAFKTGTVGTIVVTIGTTGTGSVEPLHRILPLAKHYGVRVHADCAYGGFFTILARVDRPIIDPAPFLALKECDSIVVDPHKHGLQPYGCGCILFKDPGVGPYYKHQSPYTYFTSKELHLGEISLECSRAGASAAALWATLKYFPLTPSGGLGDILIKTREAALLWNKEISEHSEFHMFAVPDLDIVTYFPSTTTFRASEISSTSQKIFEQSMHQPTHPLFLATMSVHSSLIAEKFLHFVPDTPSTTILRSVLMKPEHREYVPHFIQELNQCARSSV
ncbi:MAG: pyridoxal-dependent decarboxylase [Bacteroidota bacterium]